MAHCQAPSKASYGNCDTFFVESDDNTAFQQRVEARERARAEAKERQRALAGELSRLTGDQYKADILQHMEYMEHETLPDVNSIDIQTEIQWFMRPYLLEFLVEAHAAFSLLPDTLFLAVNLLDRYCSRRVVYKRHYQLVGCAALLIAAKYSDRKDRVPTVKELRSMCCALYDDEMFTQMEWHVLQTLDWLVGHPTVDSFLQVALAEGSYDPEVEHMSWYLLELGMFHKEFVSVLPSVMARSSLCLARCILSGPAALTSDWDARCDPYIVERLFAHLHQASAVVAKKYASNHLSAVSSKAQVFIDQQAELERVRQMCPPTPPMELDMVDDQKPGMDHFGNPQTPQKSNYPTAMVNGLYTPPITPESSQVMVENAKHSSTLPQMCPATPSPPSAGVHLHPLRCEYVYPQLYAHDPVYYVQ